MSDPLWKVTKSEPHWLEAQDPEGWYSAVCKWDGCVHFYKYSNVPLGERTGKPEDAEHELADYVHFCGGVNGIEEEINRLRALVDLARKHFPDREAWPKKAATP